MTQHVYPKGSLFQDDPALIYKAQGNKGSMNDLMGMKMMWVTFHGTTLKRFWTDVLDGALLYDHKPARSLSVPAWVSCRNSGFFPQLKHMQVNWLLQTR